MGNYSDFDTEVMTPYDRKTQFTFFAANGDDGILEKTIDIGKRWELKEIRVRCSSAFASTEDFIVATSQSGNLSTIFNMTLLSYAIIGSQNLWVDYLDPLVFESDEKMIFTLSCKSGANELSLRVIGWAVLG
jgi:hypothetical protein